MVILSIFIISITSFIVFCLYAGLDLILRTLKNNGPLYVIKSAVLIFLAVAIMLILSVTLSSVLSEPDISGKNSEDIVV